MFSLFFTIFHTFLKQHLKIRWKYHPNDFSDSFVKYPLSWKTFNYALIAVFSVLLYLCSLPWIHFLRFPPSLKLSISSRAQPFINFLPKNCSYVSCLLIHTVSAVYLSFFASHVSKPIFWHMGGLNWGLFCKYRSIMLLFLIPKLPKNGQYELELYVEGLGHFPVVWSSLFSVCLS